jgi:hypothetical protein
MNRVPVTSALILSLMLATATTFFLTVSGSGTAYLHKAALHKSDSVRHKTYI